VQKSVNGTFTGVLHTCWKCRRSSTANGTRCVVCHLCKGYSQQPKKEFYFLTVWNHLLSFCYVWPTTFYHWIHSSKRQKHHTYMKRDASLMTNSILCHCSVLAILKCAHFKSPKNATMAQDGVHQHRCPHSPITYTMFTSTWTYSVKECSQLVN